MNVTVNIPDDLAAQLSAAGGDLSRRALEAFGLEEYKSARITQNQLRRLLGFANRYELDGFSKTSVARQTPSENWDSDKTCNSSSRETLRTMENPVDHDPLFIDAVNRQPGKSGENQFSGSRYPSGSAFARKIRERVEAVADLQRNSPRGGGAIPLGNVVTETGEIVDGRFRPPKPHSFSSLRRGIACRS